MNPTYTALIALMRSGEISMESGESLPASSAQFSVRIRPESRVFLDRCAEHLGISRAALFGLCIDGILAEVRGSIADRASTLYERFCLLMDAHGLNVVEQAQLLASWGSGPVYWRVRIVRWTCLINPYCSNCRPGLMWTSTGCWVTHLIPSIWPTGCGTGVCRRLQFCVAFSHCSQ